VTSSGSSDDGYHGRTVQSTAPNRGGVTPVGQPFSDLAALQQQLLVLTGQLQQLMAENQRLRVAMEALQQKQPLPQRAFPEDTAAPMETASSTITLKRSRGVTTPAKASMADSSSTAVRSPAQLGSYSAAASTLCTPSCAHSEEDIVMHSSPGRSSGGGSGAARCLTLEASSSQ
jgi:hypothetical protein